MKKLNLAKKIAFITLLGFVPSLAQAEIKFSGSGELDLYYRTHQVESKSGDIQGAPNEEIAIILNIDGKHEGNEVIKDIKWRLAQKIATDYRYDSFGIREAWLGGDTILGEFRFGNQFSNLYLLEDWPYGSGGAGNIWSDFGAHEVQYGRGVSYFSPDFHGLSFSAQYDIGAKNRLQVKDDKDNIIADRGIVSSYAGETVVTYDTKYLTINAGYYQGRNSSGIDSEADVFGGNKSDMSAGYAQAINEAEEFYLGTILKLDKFNLYTAYSHNHWQGELPDVLGEDTRLNKILIRASYRFLPNHAISLGYMRLFNSKTETNGQSVNNNDKLDILNTQYDYQYNSNISLFIQARHQIARGDKPSVIVGSWQLDGLNANAKSVTRILVGTAVSF